MIEYPTFAQAHAYAMYPMHRMLSYIYLYILLFLILPGTTCMLALRKDM